MNSSFYRFILDVQTEQSQTSIPVSLYDTAVTLYMTLTDGGKPYVIDTGCLAKLTIARPSGSKVHEFCIIEGNHSVVYPFSQNPSTASEQGIHECELTVYGLNGEQITSPRFSMVVSDRVVNMDDNDSITDEHIGIVDAMIHNEQERRGGEMERVSAEADRVAAESQRVEDEALRVSAESEREAAEESRMSNYKRINADTVESIRKIVREQESIVALQNSLIENGTTQERLAEIIELQQSYIGGNAT
jgi:hypothetical protein